jgi:hypothetical protein
MGEEPEMIPTSLDTMRKSVALPPQPKNSFTVAEYMERYKIKSLKTAERELKDMVNDGTLKTTKCFVQSRLTRVYWIP